MATAQQTAEAAFWLDQYASNVEEVKERAAETARASWASFVAWYDAAAVAALATETASLSRVGQEIVAGAAAQYTAAVIASLRQTRIETPRIEVKPVRNGADMRLVHTRTAEAYRRAIATGDDHQTALAKALGRAEAAVLTDMSLAERDAQDEMMRKMGVTHYRRVVRPELSESGTCGLCLVAADRLYHTGTLLPIHPPHCKCKTMPVIDGNDPGLSLNREDLDRIYQDAAPDKEGGSTYAEDLKNVRYKINEHGEFGLVLSRAGDNFRGPGKTLENDPERAARMLEKTLPVLDRLEADGGPEGPLQYQRELVARLRRIVGS